MNEERTDPAHLRALAEGATPVPGDWYVPADAEAAFRAAVSPPVLLALLDRLERVEGAAERLRRMVDDAVSAGLALEDTYETSLRQRHNYEDWDHEQWDRIQEARNALCAFAALRGEP